MPVNVVPGKAATVIEKVPTKSPTLQLQERVHALQLALTMLTSIIRENDTFGEYKGALDRVQRILSNS